MENVLNFGKPLVGHFERFELPKIIKGDEQVRKILEDETMPNRDNMLILTYSDLVLKTTYSMIKLIRWSMYDKRVFVDSSMNKLSQVDMGFFCDVARRCKDFIYSLSIDGMDADILTYDEYREYLDKLSFKGVNVHYDDSLNDEENVKVYIDSRVNKSLVAIEKALRSLDSIKMVLRKDLFESDDLMEYLKLYHAFDLSSLIVGALSVIEYLESFIYDLRDEECASTYVPRVVPVYEDSDIDTIMENIMEHIFFLH